MGFPDSRAGGRRRRLAGLAVVASLSTVAILGPPATPAAAKQPVYGVVTQDGAVPSAPELKQMARGGVDRIRLLLHWANVERVRGTYDWGVADEMVRKTTKRGIKPFFFVYGTPDWAAELDGRSGCAAIDCSVYPPSSRTTRRAFAAFAGAAARRYGPRGGFWKAPCGCRKPHPLRTWQLWNEQNSAKYYPPRVDIKAYGKLVKRSGRAIKRADPGADVILGGTWGPAGTKGVLPIGPYLRALYRVKGIKKRFDSIALHPYGADRDASLAQLEVARRAVKRAGDRHVGIWVTELGWASGGPRQNPYVKGPRRQARLLSRTLRSFARERRRFNLRGVFWYTWRDQPGGEAICEWCGYTGLRDLDGSPKPAWRAFVRIAKDR